MEVNKSVDRLIREFCMERELYQDEAEAEREIRRMVRELKKGNVTDSSRLIPENAEEYAVFYLYQKEEDEELAEQEIQRHMPKENAYQMYHIVVITDTCQKRMQAKRWGVSVRKSVKNKIGCGLSAVNCQVLNYYGGDSRQFFIGIGDRMNRIDMPGKAEKSISVGKKSIAARVKAYTYTASLYDIVMMYNAVGDELFRRNVRYGIKDQLDVEENIKKTLRESPEDFWFLNNGITILVQEEEALDHKKNNGIYLNYKNAQTISVINGAQTISTAAEFWYENMGDGEEDSDDSRIEAERIRTLAKEKAKVLLRVMCVAGNEGECQEELDQISISLNRQKPIKTEDIAYTSPVILEINQLYSTDEQDSSYFRITKRGEEVLGKYKYNLTEFARIVKAYKFQKPGEARTQTANKLLKSGADIEETIYAEKMVQTDAETVFRQWYQPVNFSMKAMEYYREYAKRQEAIHTEDAHTEISRIVNAILVYGRYYYVAYIIHILHPDSSDYSDFHGKMERFDQSLDRLTERYVKVFGKIAEEYLKKEDSREEKNIDSNTFKNEKLYRLLISYKEKGENKTIKEELKMLELDLNEWFYQES